MNPLVKYLRLVTLTALFLLAPNAWSGIRYCLPWLAENRCYNCDCDGRNCVLMTGCNGPGPCTHCEGLPSDPNCNNYEYTDFGCGICTPGSNCGSSACGQPTCSGVAQPGFDGSVPLALPYCQAKCAPAVDPPPVCNPRPGPRGAGKPGDPYSVGDPVAIAFDQGVTVDRSEDFFVRTTLGEVPFIRTYYSDDRMSRGVVTDGGALLDGVPKPFGSSPTDITALRWTHNFMAFADIRLQPDGGGFWTVRAPDGNQYKFAPCAGSSCWASERSDMPARAVQLKKVSGTQFQLLTATGRATFAAPYADGGWLFLSQLETPEAQVFAQVTYATPDAGSCTPAPGTSGVPYVANVAVPGGSSLAFNYTRLQNNTSGAYECVVSGVDLLAGTRVPAVRYTYTNGASGLLASVRAPLSDGGAWLAESYGYDGGFSVVRNGTVLVFHANTSVDAGWDLSGSYTLSPASPDAGYTCPANTCCSSGYARTVGLPAAQFGDGSSTSAGLSRVAAFTVSRGPSVPALTGPLSMTETCSGAGCSPGTTTWLSRSLSDGGWGQQCGDTSPTYLAGYQDKRGNWTTWPASPGMNGRLEVKASLRGVPNNDAGRPVEPSALERTDYGVAYFQGAIQTISTESQASSLIPSTGLKTTSYVRNSVTNQITSVDVAGFSLDLNNSRISRFTCTSYEYDANGRLSRLAGPCAPSGLSPCSPTSPSTEYVYDSVAGTFSAGRLATLTRRYNGGAGALVTKFENYTALGDPQRITDENLVETNYTYVGHQVATRSVTTDAEVQTWAYGWENEKLTSIKYPEGNQDIFCYQATTNPSCSGAWTGRLTSRTRYDSTGTNWSERVEYLYWPDGTLRNEKRSVWNGSSADYRFEQGFAADPHGRRSQVTTGSGGGSFTSVRGYDSAGNVSAIGAPYGSLTYGSPPPFCSAGGGLVSSVCTVLSYDAADRLAQVDQKPDPASSLVRRACIDYDAQGNVKRVTAGCLTSDVCANGNGTGLSTCAGIASTDYVTDDFGNVVQVSLPGSLNGTSVGVLRLEYDVAGNLIKQQTQQQRNYVPSRFVQHTYDQLNRRTVSKEVRSATPYAMETSHEMARWSYDDDATAIADPFVGCAAMPQMTKGRLRATRDPVFTRWFQYDALGRVVKEIRVPNGATDCSGQVTLTNTWSPNGNLTSMTYGYGRKVTYVYGSGALTDRESSVQVSVFAGDGGVSARSIATAVKWEPFGGVRSYTMQFPVSANSATVENEVGAASTMAVSACPTSAASETNDRTGRLRSIRVWDSATNIYRRTYVWRADQVERIDSCYKGGPDVISEVYSADAGSPFGYDGMGQLLGVLNPNFDSNGGPMRRRQYTYDSRGNMTGAVLDQYGFGYAMQYDGGSQARDRLSRIQGNLDSMNVVDVRYDNDGRVTGLSGVADSSGVAPTLQLSWVSDSYNQVGPGEDIVLRASTRSAGGTGNAIFTYYYDSANRRQLKVYPANNVSDVFLYDTGHQLLEDRGNYSMWTGAPYPIDEYVWLGGKPIAVYRASLDSSFKHQADDTGSCTRMGDGVNCGIYFLVTDHIGKPVVVLDGSRRIAGAGEYEPYGHVNRVQWWSSTAHPYTTGGESWSPAQYVKFRQKKLGMEVSFRAHFPMVDTDQDCNGNVREGPSLWNSDDTVMHEVVGGYARGDQWTNWYQSQVDSSAPAWGTIVLRWGTNLGNCNPTNCNIACNSSATWPYSGFVLREYEYRRFESGATPYFPALRFPGQYYDAETDLHENWNRYCFPFAGRYLSPEPMLQSPNFLRGVAQQGRSLPTYAYANNNPLRFQDRDGRFAGLLPFLVAAADAIGLDIGLGALAGGLAVGGANSLPGQPGGPQLADDPPSGEPASIGGTSGGSSPDPTPDPSPGGAACGGRGKSDRECRKIHDNLIKVCEDWLLERETERRRSRIKYICVQCTQNAYLECLDPGRGTRANAEYCENLLRNL